MKLGLTVVCCLVGLVPVLAPASISSMLDATPSKQQMQLASSVHTSPGHTSPQLSDAAQLAKVRSIMSHDKQKQLIKSHAAQPLAAEHEVKDVASAKAPAPLAGGNADKISELQSQLSSLNQEMLMLQQRTDGKIESLTSQLQVSQQRSNQLTKALKIMNQEVSGLTKALSLKPMNRQSAAIIDGQQENAASWEYYVGQYGYWVLGLILLLLLCYFIYLKRNVNRAAMNAGSTDQHEEYDFLGSQEGVAAKLDLARSYLAMEDYDQMRQVLTEVMQQGDDDQKQQAQQLLKQIAK